MARTAGQRCAMPLLHERRRRRVFVWKPVGRVAEIVDLLRRVTLAAARDALRTWLFGRNRSIDRRKRPAWTGRGRLLRSQHKNGEGEGASESATLEGPPFHFHLVNK